MKPGKFFAAIIAVLFAGHAPQALGDVPADFPEVTVNVLEDPSPGYLFLSNFSFTDVRENVPFLMVLDNSGFPVLHQELDAPINMDFKRQPDGRLSYCDLQRFVFLDSNLVATDSVGALEGCNVDGHEIRVLEGGNRLFLSWRMRTADMTAFGGRPNARLQDMAIQETDPDGNLVWIWETAEHFEVTDATRDIPLTGMYVDWVHCNAVDVDTDGNILLSSRHLDEITKIDRATGDILWRFGGMECKNNMFTFVDDVVMDGQDTLYYGFSHQHGVRRLENGNILLLDNGNLKDPQFSRVVEYELDEANLVARKVWEYRHDPDIFTSEMGFAQRLPNGNTLIGWGGNADGPAVTEVRPNKTVVFEMSLPYDIVSYRAMRFVHRMAAVTRVIGASGLQDFREEGNNTGVRLELPEPAESESITVQRHLYGAHEIRFAAQESAPDETLDRRWVISRTSDSRLDASLRFDLRLLPEVGTPAAVTAYFRPREGSGEFEAVPTSYDRNAQEIVVAITGGGEYILGSTAPADSGDMSSPIALGQNVPNPFTAGTVIRFHVASSGAAALSLYNARGERAKTLFGGFLEQGSHEIAVDGSELPSGIYFYELRFDGHRQTKKMILVH